VLCILLSVYLFTIACKNVCMRLLDSDVFYAFQLSVSNDTTNHLRDEHLYPYSFFVTFMHKF
jgi:hypothetical protein